MTTINTNSPAELLATLSGLSVSELRTANYLLSEELLGQLSSEQYWNFFAVIVPSNSKGYLGTLARNTAINEKKKCIPDYQINDEVIADISDDFNQVELRLLLANALRKLNKDEQLILVLFYFQNEKIADISRITSIPASTVKSKLKRCKEKMKKFLEEGGNQYENFV